MGVKLVLVMPGWTVVSLAATFGLDRFVRNLVTER